MRSIYALSLSLALLPALAFSARADLVFETEPNNTIDTANQTVGFNDISFEGFLTLGDIDSFTIRLTPASDGMLSLRRTVEWSPTTFPFNGWLNIRNFITPDSFNQDGVISNFQIATIGYTQSVPSLHYFQLWASPTPAGSSPIPGSTIQGRYRVRYQAINGSIIGSSVPEPSSVLLGLALTGSGFYLKRRNKKGSP